MLSKALSGTLALLFTLAIATLPNDSLAQSDSKRSSSNALKVKNSRASSVKPSKQKRDKPEKRSGRSKGKSAKNKGKGTVVSTGSYQTVLVTNGPADPIPAVVIPSVAPVASSPLASATATSEFIGDVETYTLDQAEEDTDFISTDAPPMATGPRPLTEAEQCTLQVVNERLVRCCDGGSDGNRYGPYYNCTNFTLGFHEWCKDKAYDCKTVTLACDDQGAGHAANLIWLGTSWGLLDPTNGKLIGTYENTPGALACKAMGYSESDCNCDSKQGCKCRIISTSDDPRPPNTNPAYCSNMYPPLRTCLSCCETYRATRTGIGVEVCKERMPRSDEPDYVGWMLMCAKYGEELQSWHQLCEHACNTNV